MERLQGQSWIYKCYKCLCSDRNYQKYFDEGIEKRFGNTNNFFGLCINKFLLMLLKVIYW